MSSDKRSVATDALETLGTIIDEGAGRDAIHLAVEPVIAASLLGVGDDVGILQDGRAGYSNNPVGIVDPFLKKPVEKGERFWLVVYPRQITSLRHVWSHPAFAEAKSPSAEDVEMASKVAKKLMGITPSQQWVKEYAERIGVGYDDLMQHAKEHADRGSYWVEGGRFEGMNIPQGFWDHYEKITGEEVDEENRDSFFSCAC